MRSHHAIVCMTCQCQDLLTNDPDFRALGKQCAETQTKTAYRKAITYFTKSIDIEPNFEAAYFQRGRMHDLLDENQAALDDYTQAVSLQL